MALTAPSTSPTQTKIKSASPSSGSSVYDPLTGQMTNQGPATYGAQMGAGSNFLATTPTAAPTTPAVPSRPHTQPTHGTPTPGTSVNGSMATTAPIDSSEAAVNAYEANMPGYIANQTNAAQDTARANLANDIQNNRASANSRGLLQSGLEGGAEDTSRATEGSNLAGNIQTINSNALGELGTLQNNAVVQAQQEGQNATAIAGLQASANQTAYEQALSEQQNQDAFYEGLMGAAGKLIGGGVAAATG